MPKITSSYIKGLNQDLSISNNDNQHLFNALDIDLVTNTGQSTGIISNHKGNKLEFSIPDIQPFYSITITGSTNAVLVINGTNVNISLAATTDPIDVYDAIIANATIAADIAAGEYGVYYNSQEVVIQGYSLNPSPSVTSGSLAVATVVTAQSNLSIIGWGTLEEEIILLTTSNTNTSETPSNTAGQVWVLQYDDSTESIIGASGTSLVASEHLKYNNILDFSLAHEVYREALGRKESSLRGTFYWTDNYNHPRALNVYNPQCPAVPKELLDWKPSVDMSTPIIEGVLAGGLLEVGTYQISYQLYSNDGAITAYAPVSKLVPLTDSVISSNQYANYEGAPVGTISGKSIQTTINHIDLKYDFIRVVLVQYQVENVPTINAVFDLPIDGDSMSFTITGGEDKIAISVEEFVNPLIFFDRVKTFTQKKNRLYPANTRSRTFDLDYEARAYRFNSSQLCRLYSRDGSFQDFDATIPADITALHALDDDEDAVNAYNDESGTIFGLVPGGNYDNWLNSHQSKFQEDGVTIGGEGANVSYKFVTQSLRADSTMDFAFNGTVASTNLKNYNLINSPFVNNLNTSSGSDNLGTPSLAGFAYPQDGWSGYKNPLRSTVYAGHARGEVYRYGVVFYNDKGEESFIKWISDIRIPEPWEAPAGDLDAFDLSEYLDDGAGDKRINTKSIGIEFTFTNLPSDITGFRVVRVERQKKDKTRLGTGALFGALRSRVRINGDKADCLSLASFADSNHNSPVHFINNDFSEGETGLGYIYGVPGEHGDTTAATRVTRENSLGIIKFPELDFNEYQTNDATHIKLLSLYSFSRDLPTVPGPPPGADADTYYTGVNDSTGRELFNQGVCYWADYVDNNTKASGAFLVKYTSVFDNGRNIVTLLNQQEVDIEGIIPSSFSPTMLALDYHHIGIECFKSNADFELSSFGTKSLFCRFGGSCQLPDTPFNNSHIDYPLYNETTKDPYFRIVALCRYNTGQYGGPWRASRYNNEYIAASDFFPIDIVASTQSIKVYNGDIYTSYYDTTLTFFHWKEDYSYPSSGTIASASGLGAIYDPASTRMSALAICFPCETEFNIAYRHGDLWNNEQVFTSDTTATIQNIAAGAAGPEFAKFLAEAPEYNRAYSQENNIKKYFPRPFNFLTDEEHPNWVWVSEEKFDREIQDNWRRYLVNNYLPLEGNYGPINKITNLKERLFTLQDRGVSIVSSQEQTALPDSATGAIFQVGTGTILARYDYLSKEYGCFHQHSVITGPGAVYFFDSRIKRFFRIGESKTGPMLESLSDVKGLSAFFRKKLEGDILDTDKVLLNNGIHGVYDSVYNKAYMTFLNKIAINFDTFSISAGSPTIYTMTNVSPSSIQVLNKGDIFYIGNNVYKVESINQTTLAVSVVSGTITALQNKQAITYKFTIGFNEMLQAFESFYTFTPNLYLSTGKRLLSANPFDTSNSVYLHNEGDYGKFYGKNPTTSEAEFIVNFPDATKLPTFRIDTLEFWTEVFDNNGIDIPLETITGILLYNDYQSTQNSLTLLTPQQNVVRRERTWRINMINDYNSPLPIKPYLRDVYVKIKVFYNNSNNRNFRLNAFNTNVTLSVF